VDLWSSLSFLWTPDIRCNQACYLIWISFPPCQGTPFPPNFKEVVKTIFKRLFRVYAHIYHSHFQKIVSLKEEAHLNTCFKHFILFTNVGPINHGNCFLYNTITYLHGQEKKENGSI
jgi:hypothetical protein